MKYLFLHGSVQPPQTQLSVPPSVVLVIVLVVVVVVTVEVLTVVQRVGGGRGDVVGRHVDAVEPNPAVCQQEKTTLTGVFLDLS